MSVLATNCKKTETRKASYSGCYQCPKYAQLYPTMPYKSLHGKYQHKFDI